MRDTKKLNELTDKIIELREKLEQANNFFNIVNIKFRLWKASRAQFQEAVRIGSGILYRERS